MNIVTAEGKAVCESELATRVGDTSLYICYAEILTFPIKR